MSRIPYTDEYGLYHFVYLTTNLINGKKYLGKHSTYKLDDGYIGCGVTLNNKLKDSEIGFRGAVNKYGYSSFSITKLLFFNSSERAFRAEKLLGFIWNVRLCEEFYNLKDCGIYGGGHTVNHSNETKLGISITKKRMYEEGIIVAWNKGLVGAMPAPWNKGTKGLMIAWNKGLKSDVIPWNKGTVGIMVAWNKGLNLAEKEEVLQFNLKGELIKEWYSCTEADRSGFSIRPCCTHETNSCENFIWIYKSEFTLDPNIFNIKLSKLNVNKDKTIVQTWNKDKIGVYSEETLQKWSSVRKGRVSPNKDKPMKEEQKLKLKLANKGKSKEFKEIECPHCGVMMKENVIYKYHFSHCKQNPNYIIKETVICPYCKIEGYSNGSLYRFHFENCKQNPDYIDRRELLTCPHCDYKSKNKSNMKQYHNDNCKLKPKNDE